MNVTRSRRISEKYLWTLVPLLLLAAALRMADFGSLPPGLYHDEAYNGLDALKVLDGDLALYFSANNGREPMFIYLIALWVGMLGRSPWAVRLAALGPGLLTVAATYAMAREMFSRRVGWLSAAVLSVTLWHVHLSRVGFRAVLLPLFVALTLWQGALGWRTGRRRYWIAAGALYGLSFYTYMAVRFTIVALGLYGLYYILARRAKTSPSTEHPWHSPALGTNLGWAGLAALVTLGPLILLTLCRPDLVLGRTGQVAVWSPQIHGGDFWGTLTAHAGRTLGMFFIKGDRIWRHNVPGRPIFDPLLGAFFVLGGVRALKSWRRQGAMALLVIWTVTMTLPTLLAEDAPHFLRAVGVLPLVAVFPALGMDWLLAQQPSWRWRTTLPIGLIAVTLLFALGNTATAYFGDYAHADMAAYWFEDGAEALAGAVNGFLGDGWDGEQMRHGTPDKRDVYIDPALWEISSSVSFLVPPSPAVHTLPVGAAWPPIGNSPAAIFVWPYEDPQRLWPMLSAPAQIRIERGPLSQGDRDPEPFITYRAFYVSPVETPPQAVARFQDGVHLVGHTMQRTPKGVRVELEWFATADLGEDYTVFVHYMRDGQRIGQDDAQPAEGHYPTRLWRAGDWVHDTHFIALDGAPDPARDQLYLGFYRPLDGQRLDLLDQAGNPAGTYFILPVIHEQNNE
jgi:4-amino-4-deoxy-L-arabinose transferase-like glycosyltransferase